jgi:hypothetical protein
MRLTATKPYMNVTLKPARKSLFNLKKGQNSVLTVKVKSRSWQHPQVFRDRHGAVGAVLIRAN